MLLLSLVYFGDVACLYAVSFWLPSIVKDFGVSTSLNGWISAIPYVVGFFGMMWWGLRSDLKGERTPHLVIALWRSPRSASASPASSTIRYLKMLALSFGSFGVFASLPIFWTLPTAILGAGTAAAGIAAINSLGNLSGYFGPFVMGYIKDAHRQLHLGAGRRRALRGDRGHHYVLRSVTTILSKRRRNTRRPERPQAETVKGGNAC